jgi:integrase/recombinase XerD
MKRRQKNRRLKPPVVVPPNPAEHSACYPYAVQYLETCAARGYSMRTLEGQRLALKRFIGWCLERSIERPQDVTRPILERYRRWLYHFRQENGEPFSFAHQTKQLSTLRLFFRWLTRENFILSNPASELELPRLHKTLPARVLSRDEVERVMQQAMLHGTHAVRDRAILETLYSTGIRRCELVNLKIYDLDLRNRTLFVRQGKGHKDRYVPLGSRAIEWLRRYLEEVRPHLVLEPDEGYLFVHDVGEPFNGHRLSDRVKHYVLTAGVAKKGSCHLFRHAMATQMLENGADIRFIQAILGHSQLSTTEIYTHVTIAKLKEVHMLTHPAERAAATARLAESPEQDEEAQALLTSLAAEDAQEEREGIEVAP